MKCLCVSEEQKKVRIFFFQAEDGIRDISVWLEFRRVLFRSPKSRNETLASMMRRFRICEERGSGIDKVIAQVEMFQLPAPIFEVPEGFTRVILFAHRPLNEMRQDGSGKSLLPPCLPTLCPARFYDQYYASEAVWNRTKKQRHGLENHSWHIAIWSHPLSWRISRGQGQKISSLVGRMTFGILLDCCLTVSCLKQAEKSVYNINTLKSWPF